VVHLPIGATMTRIPGTTWVTFAIANRYQGDGMYVGSVVVYGELDQSVVETEALAGILRKCPSSEGWMSHAIAQSFALTTPATQPAYPSLFDRITRWLTK